MKLCSWSNCLGITRCWAGNSNGNKLYSTISPSKHMSTNVTGSMNWNLSGNLFKRGNLSFVFDGRLASYNWQTNI